MLFYLCLFPLLGKILIIGGSIANFTNVAATFKVSDCLEMPMVGSSKPFCPGHVVLILTVHLLHFTCPSFLSQGIVRAIKDYQGPLKEHEVRIFVRRGGPNYQEGLRVMGEVGKDHPFPSVLFSSLVSSTCFVWSLSEIKYFALADAGSFSSA